MQSLKFSYKPLTFIKRYNSVSLTSIITPEQQEYFPNLGNREIVGFGKNGVPGYVDNNLFPYPAVRWKSYDEHNLKLKGKEQGDWTLLTLSDKKELYRISFRQTFIEFTTASPHWKYALSVFFFTLGLSVWVLIFVKKFIITEELPETFTKEGWQLRMYKRIYTNYGHITGIASKWDFDNLRWKE